MCSKLVRYSLKEPHRSIAIKRGEQGLKSARWSEGKQGEVSKYLYLLFQSNHLESVSVFKNGK